MVSFTSVLNVKVLVGAFNQEKALVGAFSVIVKTDGSFRLQRNWRERDCRNLNIIFILLLYRGLGLERS